MKKQLKIIAQISTGIGAALILCAGKAMAFSVQEGAEAARADGMPTNLIGPTGIFTQISNTILYIVGIISVIMLVWGGLRYIISGGDSKKVNDAKNTVLYAIIGLIIAILSYVIINFVLNAVGTTDQTVNPETTQTTGSDEPDFDHTIESSTE